MLYEDEDVIVQVSPSDEEIKSMIKRIISKHGRPLYPVEIKNCIPYLVSIDRVKRLLKEMIEAGELVEMVDCTVGFPEMMANYVPTRILNRYRPLVPRKYFETWGHLITSLGGIKAAVRYLISRTESNPTQP